MNVGAAAQRPENKAGIRVKKRAIGMLNKATKMT
jgi:hypothetical protein